MVGGIRSEEFAVMPLFDAFYIAEALVLGGARAFTGYVGRKRAEPFMRRNISSPAAAL